MMRFLSEFLVMLSASPAASLVAKGTVVLALGLISAWFARKSRAAVRHALLAATFSVLLALPIVSFLATPVPVTVPAAKGDGNSGPLFDYISVPASGEPAPERFSAVPAKPGWPLFPLSTILLYGWFVCAALFMIPIVRALLHVCSLRRYGLPWRHGQAVAEGLASGARRTVEVLLHESLPGPMTCGVLNPVIILPADAQSWEEEDLKRALVHELEHVRRYDWSIQCFARVACAAYWFHPLVWIAWRQLKLEAERSCDDAVLRSSEATSYADQLVGVARRRSVAGKSALLAMAGRSDLAARIGAVLDGSQRRGPVGALLVAAACIAAAAVVLTMSPLRMVAAPRSPLNGLHGAVPPAPVQAASADVAKGQSEHKPLAFEAASVTPPHTPAATTPLHLDVSSSFDPVAAPNSGDALVIHGTLPRLAPPPGPVQIAQVQPAPANADSAQAVSARSADPPLAFDAASVKVTDPRLRSRGFGIFTQYSPTTLTIRDISMWMCIRLAYGLENFRIAGPDSMQSPPFYDIVAKAASPVPESQLRLMLRKLLADRFHLTLHWEKREMQVMALLAAKGGSKMHTTTGAFDPGRGDDAHMQNLGYDSNVQIQRSAGANGNVRFTFTNASMALFATWLESSSSVFIYDKAPVVDLTGMEGRFDWVVDSPLVRPPSGGDGGGAPIVADGNTGGVLLDQYKPILESELGLTLERRKAVVDILVIDHVDQEPTPN